MANKKLLIKFETSGGYDKASAQTLCPMRYRVILDSADADRPYLFEQLEKDGLGVEGWVPIRRGIPDRTYALLLECLAFSDRAREERGGVMWLDLGPIG